MTVALLAGDIGQSGLVPGRAPVHSISTFYVPGNIVVTNPPPWAPIGGGSKVPKLFPSAGRPGGMNYGVFLKFFFRNFRHCLHNVVNIFFLTHRVAVHVFPGTRAQVYTRDATHRPTATSTPGRGAFLRSWSGKCRSRGGECREMSEFSEIFRNFRKKVKKSENYPPPARAGGGFFGVLGVKFSGNLGKFHEISEKSHFSTPPRGGVKNPQIWPKNPPPGGG